jgi:hypothetical protein
VPPAHVVCYGCGGAARKPKTKYEERAQGMKGRAKTQQTTHAWRAQNRPKLPLDIKVSLPVTSTSSVGQRVYRRQLRHAWNVVGRNLAQRKGWRVKTGEKNRVRGPAAIGRGGRMGNSASSSETKTWESEIQGVSLLLAAAGLNAPPRAKLSPNSGRVPCLLVCQATGLRVTSACHVTRILTGLRQAFRRASREQRHGTRCRGRWLKLPVQYQNDNGWG